MKNKIAVLIPYFGRFPEWFDMYLYSCSRNDFIDFIFFTDCEIPLTVYENTIFYATSFESYCSQASTSLGIEFKPSHAYKLCDLRPFYGQIHSDLLLDYDFWGYGDIDLVYGDLTLIFNRESLSSYDIFSAHCDRLSGHCTLIRKNSKYHTLCYRIPDWKNKLMDDRHWGLDEVDQTRLVYPELKWVSRWYRYFYRFLGINEWRFREIVNSIVRTMSRRFFKEYRTTMLPKDNEIWVYNPRDNRVFAPDMCELPYLHFMFFKKTQYAVIEQYWREGFWQVPFNYDYSSSSNNIVIDNNSIKIEK